MGNAKSVNKTNAARLLDKAGVHYELVPYEYDETDLAAPNIARTLGIEAGRLFKTIVLQGERTGHFVCVLPGDAEIDLKLAAKAAGDKKADLIPVKELLPLTGYIRGGCSPVGMKKSFPTFFHSSATHFDHIYVSSGLRGIMFKINPLDLIAYTGATLADIIKTEP